MHCRHVKIVVRVTDQVSDGGPAGRVHAIDVDPRMIALVEERAREAGVANVRPLLAPDGGAVPPEPCDVVLVVNTFHQFADGPANLRSLAGRLRPGGRIVNVDFHQGELPVGPPPDHTAKVPQLFGQPTTRSAWIGVDVKGERPLSPLGPDLQGLRIQPQLGCPPVSKDFQAVKAIQDAGYTEPTPIQ